MEEPRDGGDRVLPRIRHRVVAEVEPFPVAPSRFGHVDSVEKEEERLTRLQRVVEAVAVAGEELPDFVGVDVRVWQRRHLSASHPIHAKRPVSMG